MPLAAGDRIGPYEIVARIGGGGMGEVYRARDTILGRAVAVKILAPSVTRDAVRVSRLRHEARVLATFSHPNIAAIHGWDDSTGEPALIMELVDGRPLDQIIPRHGLPFADAIAIATQIAAALEAAHRAGIVHRDLKPSNVIVSSGGVAKLLDFGLGRAVGGAVADDAATVTETAASMTGVGTVAGTVAYMSPEQAQG